MPNAYKTSHQGVLQYLHLLRRFVKSFDDPYGLHTLQVLESQHFQGLTQQK